MKNNKTGIYKSISKGEMMDSLKNSFSYEASEALIEYYDSFSEEIGEMIEWDVVAIREEWNEYESKDEAMKEYNKTWQEIEDNTIVMEIKNGGVLLKAF